MTEDVVLVGMETDNSCRTVQEPRTSHMQRLTTLKILDAFGWKNYALLRLAIGSAMHFHCGSMRSIIHKKM